MSILNFLFRQPPKNQPLNPDDIEVRIWGFVVVVVTLILAFIVFALLYSVTFVTQPIKSMAPIDQAYTKMLNDIVLLIVGGIGGVMSKRASKPTQQPRPPVQQCPGVQQYTPVQSTSMPDFNWMGYKNPDLDESWTPPPPPTTPPDLLEDDDERQHMALARKETE